MLITHMLIVGYRNRLEVDQEAFREVLRFGKWILLSTAMTFLAMQADRFVLGKLVPFEFLGVYALALMIAEFPRQMIAQISSVVVFPGLARADEQSRSELRAKFVPKQEQLLLAVAAGIAMMVVCGDWLIAILYDNRYEEAKWLLPALSVGLWFVVLGHLHEAVLHAFGKPQIATLGNSLKFVALLIGIPLGYSLGGVHGAIVGIAISALPFYLAVEFGTRNEGMSLCRQDLRATLIFFGILALLLAMRWSLGFGTPFDGMVER